MMGPGGSWLVSALYGAGVYLVLWAASRRGGLREAWFYLCSGAVFYGLGAWWAIGSVKRWEYPVTETLECISLTVGIMGQRQEALLSGLHQMAQLVTAIATLGVAGLVVATLKR